MPPLTAQLHSKILKLERHLLHLEADLPAARAERKTLLTEVYNLIDILNDVRGDSKAMLDALIYDISCLATQVRATFDAVCAMDPLQFLNLTPLAPTSPASESPSTLPQT